MAVKSKTALGRVEHKAGRPKTTAQGKVNTPSHGDEAVRSCADRAVKL